MLVFHGSSPVAAAFPGDFGELWPCFHTHVALAGHSLCSDPDSSVEAAPEEVEAQDLESSDEAEKMSKVRRFSFHLSWYKKYTVFTVEVFMDDPGWNKLRVWSWQVTCCLFSKIQGWVHISSTL